MTLNYRYLTIAATLVAMPLAGTLAQTNPTGNYGSNKSVTAAPGTADNKAASGLNTSDVNAKPPAMSESAAGNYAPGSTGRTTVPGSNSSVGADTANSSSAKTSGGVGGGAGGGPGK